MPAGGFPLDKLTHFSLYAVEAFLLYRAIGWSGPSGLGLSRIVAIVGTMSLWGMLDEMHQEWIPGRMMDSGDLIADVAGASVGAVLSGAKRKGRKPETETTS